MKKNQNNLSNGTSNLTSAVDLAAQGYLIKLQEENKTLVSHNVGLSQTIDKLLKELETKSSEIRHLQDLLSKNSNIIGELPKLIISDEEVIADMQLKALKSAAMMRDLTLDEVKRFDLLVKNKRLAQGNATTIEAQKSIPKNTPKDQLIQLAIKPIKMPEE